MIEQHYGGEHGFWAFILDRDNDGCLMGTSIKGDGKEGPHIVDGRQTGLILNHAYGISDVVEFIDPLDTSKKRKIRLLRLRNPWGKSEFKGAWDSESEEMQKYRGMIEKYIQSLSPDE